MNYFSVIIPMYNCEMYIAQAIESVLNQDYANFELLIIDDGSTDKSREIVCRYLDDSRIKLIEQRNMGLFHTRLIGLQFSRNEYCVFLDADDYLEKNALFVLNAALEKGKAQVIMYRLRRVWSNGKKADSPKVFQPDHFIDKEDALLELYKNNRVNNLVLKLFRRNLIPVSQLENFPRITLGEDGLFTLFLFKNADTIYYIDDVLYNYRMVDGSMSRVLDEFAYSSNKVITEQFLKSVSDMHIKEREECYASIYGRYLKKVSSVILYGKYEIKGNEKTYIKILTEIAKDPFFQSVCASRLKGQPWRVRIPIALLHRKHFKFLLYLKRIIAPIMIKK